MLSPVQLAAITRIYGEHGAEILELLRKNPCKTVPVILARLRQKDVEWRVVSRRVGGFQVCVACLGWALFRLFALLGSCLVLLLFVSLNWWWVVGGGWLGDWGIGWVGRVSGNLHLSGRLLDLLSRWVGARSTARFGHVWCVCVFVFFIYYYFFFTSVSSVLNRLLVTRTSSQEYCCVVLVLRCCAG